MKLRFLKSSHLNTKNISPRLAERFNSLGININSRVLAIVDRYHDSQVNSALDRVEANFELIKSTTAVFLYQVPRQPVKENKSRLPIYSARDLTGYTLQHLKAWYPHSCPIAAQHFGIAC